MKKICLLVAFLTLCFFNSFSVNLYSITDGSGIPGDWSDGNFWSLSPGGPACNCTPVPSDNISIQEDINLDVDLTGGDAISGILTIEAGASLSTLTHDISIKSGAILNVYGTLEVFNLEFSNGSTVYAAESSIIIVHGDLTNKNNSDSVTINGTVTVTGEFYNGNGGVIAGSGSITAGTFTGAGTTFGTQPNSSIPSGTTATSPLPIELIYFSAELNNNKTVNVKWTTAVEINNSFYTIEKTKDGKTFETVDVVQGAGNSNYVINYSLTDKNPYFGISYYRLKQSDIDGKFSLSSMVAIRNNQ